MRRGGFWVIAFLAAGCAGMPAHWPQSVLEAHEAAEAAKKSGAEQLALPSFQAGLDALKRAEASFAQDEAVAVWEEKAWKARLEFQVAEAEAMTRKAEVRIQELQSRLAADRAAETRYHEAKAEKEMADAGNVESNESVRSGRVAPAVHPWGEWGEAAKQLPGVTVRTESARLILVLPARELFKTGNSQWENPEVKIRLEPVARWLRNLPEVHVRIEGYTEDSGNSLQDNLLSQARAENLADFFHQQGISLERLEPIGLGAGLKAGKQTSEGGSLDHRLEIVVEPNK